MFKTCEDRQAKLAFPVHLGDITTFHPTKCFTSFAVDSTVHKVLQHDPLNRQTPEVQKAFTLVSHGMLSHEYSLLADPCDEYRGRPVARYTSPGKLWSHGRIIDLSLTNGQPATVFQLSLFNDSFRKGHIEFQICDEYRFEWRYDDLGHTGDKAYYLWRHRLLDGVVVPVARISNALFQSPVDNSNLWMLELDESRLSPIIGFLSAFMVKRLWMSLLAGSPLPTAPTAPTPAVNIAFEDDGIVIQRESKFYSDWEDEVAVRGGLEINMIKVFNPEFLKSYDIPDQIIEYLKAEAVSKAKALRNQFGLF